MRMGKLATLTIGQAPRHDIMPIFQAILPPDLPCLHVGVLDGLTLSDIKARFASRSGEPVLTSRLLTGDAVVMDKMALVQAIQEKIDWLNGQHCDVIALLCSGEFPRLHSKHAWLLEPDQLLPATLAALIGQRQAGVIVPLAEQIHSEAAKWQQCAVTPFFAAASPYNCDTQQLIQAVASLISRRAEIIILDCMGFTMQHQIICQRQANCPVILVNKLFASLLQNLF